MKHLRHLEWSSHGNWFEQKHLFLIKIKQRLNANDHKWPQQCVKRCKSMILCLNTTRSNLLYLNTNCHADLWNFHIQTGESLVAWCDGEWTLLHSQLVEFGELWRDSSRGRLWEGQRRQGEKWRNWKTQVEGETENTHTHQYRQLPKETPNRKKTFQ